MGGFDAAMDALMRDCVDEFASDGGFLHEPASGDVAKKVEAVFDDDHEFVSLDGGTQVSSFHPVLSVHSRDFPQGIRRGDRFVRLLTGVRYVVRDVQPDSGFGILVILHVEEPEE